MAVVFEFPIPPAAPLPQPTLPFPRPQSPRHLLPPVVVAHHVDDITMLTSYPEYS